MKTKHLATGHGYTLYVVEENARCPVMDFINDLEDKDQKQVFALLHLITEKGPPQNEEKFKKLRDGIFEVKTYRGIRILAFSGGSIYKRSLILVDGFRKPKRRELARLIDKAVEYRKAFFS